MLRPSTFVNRPSKRGSRRVNLRDFGRGLGNGADATEAMKAARDFLAPTGGEIYVPAGTYRLTETIDFIFTAADSYDDRFGINVVGDGSANTLFTVPATLALAFRITSGSPAQGSPCDICWRGFSIFADTAAITGAFDLVFAANMTFIDIFTYNFARHWRFIDALSSTFIRCKMQYGHIGMQGYFSSVSPVGSTPNAISCYGCQAYFLNQHGVLLYQPYAFLWSGGSMEGCGGSNSPTATPGDVNACAVWINGCAGGVAANIHGTHFESDVGIAVVRATADTTYEMTVNVTGCTFGNNATTAQDLIRIDAGTKRVIMNLAGSSFWDTPAYTPGGGRKDFKVYSAGPWTLLDDGVKWSSSGATPDEMSSTEHALAVITGATGAFVRGRNVSSTSRTTTGRYVINYRNNTKGAGNVIPSFSAVGSVALGFSVLNWSASMLDFQCYNATTGAAVDPATVMVAVYD